MQRPGLTSNVHFGLALGIATAGVILALSGCAVATGSGQPTASAGSATVSLEQFSAAEQTRILAVQDIVAEAAAEQNLDPALLNAMIWVESRFDPNAKSPAGARGLMQLMPSTAAYLAKRMGQQSARAYDPNFNVRAGALYLAEMKLKFGDEELAVAAYHAGPGNVKKWVAAGQAFPDYSEAYVAKVMDARARFVGVEVHGRPSAARTAAVPASPSKSDQTPTQASKPAMLTSEPDPVDDLVAPDLDTLPDAAEIHGVERVIYERAPEPEPEPEIEPVFEVHPELDRNPAAPPPGWKTKPAPESKPRTRPAARPSAPPSKPATPTTKPASKPGPEPDEVGIGVLPNL